MKTRGRGLIALMGVAALVLVLGTCGAAEEADTTGPQQIATPRAPVPGDSAEPAATAMAAATAVPLAAATAVPGADASTSKRGGILQYRLASNPRRMSPYRARFDDKEVSYYMYDSLVRIDASMGLQPMLAQSWDFSADSRTITLNLAPGVKFHDGEDFTAQAVVAHWDRIVDPETASASAAFFENVTSYEALDDLTVRFTMSAPDVVIMVRLGDYLGYIPSDKAVKAAENLDAFSRDPVAAGHFQFAEWRDDAHVKLERWDQGVFASQGLPYLDGMMFRIIADTTVALAAFKTGDLDGYEPPSIDIPEVERISGVNVAVAPNPGIRYWGINQQIKPYDDVRIRRAISMAIDRQGIVDAIYAGKATKQYNVIPNGYTWLARPDYEPMYPYNPDAARQLVIDAGFPDGVDIGPVAWGPDDNRAQGEALAAMLGEVGLRVQFVQLTHSEANRQFTVEHTLATYISHLSCSGDLDRCIRDYGSSKAPVNPSGALGKVEGLDELIDLQRVTGDLEERKRLIWAASDLIEENMLFVPVANHWQFKVVASYVKGFVAFPGHAGDNWFQVWMEK